MSGPRGVGGRGLTSGPRGEGGRSLWAAPGGGRVLRVVLGGWGWGPDEWSFGDGGVPMGLSYESHL